MTAQGGQGQSDITEWKERGIGSACAVNLRIFRKFAARYTYFHFDLNAGSGWNSTSNCIGSPIAFVRKAADYNIDRYAGYFCDIDADACRALLANAEIGQDDRCFVFHGDNSGLVPAIPDLIRERRENPLHAIGTVLIDPNGCDIPFAQLERLNVEAPKLDFIVNWNASAFRRVRRAHGGIDLSAAIEKMGKRYWLIRNPVGRHDFTLLVGRNLKVSAHKAEGFHDLQSDFGRFIFNNCNFTKQEQKQRSGQTDLFNESEISKL